MAMETENKVRRIVAPAATSLATYLTDRAAEGKDFDLQSFLIWLATSSGAGAAVYATIEYGEKLARKPFDSTFKFYTAQVLSYLYPVGAYLATVGLGWQVWTPALLVATLVVGYQVSQQIHFETPPAAPEAAIPAQPALPPPPKEKGK